MAHIASPLGNDFYFQFGQSFDLGTPKQRFENNRLAIQLAKELKSNGRQALSEELALLSQYVGWGDSRLASRVHELSNLLSEDELRSARGSTLNAHYTALPVIGAMWEAALQLGFGEHPFRALDPSAGIGQLSIVPPWLAIGALAFAACIGVLGGLYPAARAARLDPVVALKHE